MEESYTTLRGRFVDLCCFEIPTRLLNEREKNAPDEFDHFCSDPRLDGVAVNAPNMWFGTKRLAMEAPGSKFYWVGSFAVRIDVKTKSIECVGDERRGTLSASGMWHPHILANNNQACFGTGREKLTHWFGDGKYAHVALYVLEFLCLARGENHYLSPDYWQALTTEEVVEWKKLRP